MIEIYFGAERTTGLMFVTIGALAIGVAAWGWHQAGFWRGVAWPLAAVALIQIAVGVTMLWRSPKDSLRVQQMLSQAPALIGDEEIPRMQTVMKAFETNRRIEIGLLLTGLLLFGLASRGSGWQGAGAGLAIQAGLVLFLDILAARRGLVYLDWLRTL